MKEISTIGLDIAKRVFQVHGIDDRGRVVVRKKLSRNELLEWFGKIAPCLVGIESCATSTYWAREIGALGHNVKLIPPSYVKPYVRRQKNDRVDAEAICEAVGRPSMRFVTLKTIEQQAIQVLHRSRSLLITQRIQLVNALRAHMAEFGVIFPQGLAGAALAIKTLKEGKDKSIPAFAQNVLLSLVSQLEHLRQEIKKLDQQMMAWHKTNADSQRLATVPGIGHVTASAVLAAIGDGKQFNSAREFAAWLGLVPRQNSSGGKDCLGRISKKGDPYLRRLFVTGATTQLRGSHRDKTVGGAWFSSLLRRKAARVASVALANKMARVAWALLTKGQAYRPAPLPRSIEAAA